MACGTLLTYPYFKEEFKVQTNYRDFQSGAVISQKDIPITFYSRKLTESQKRYTVTEKYLLIIFETVKESRTILPGQILSIYTDNKNLTCKTLNIDIVLRWRLVLKECALEIEYIKSEKI